MYSITINVNYIIVGGEALHRAAFSLTKAKVESCRKFSALSPSCPNSFDRLPFDITYMASVNPLTARHIHGEQAHYEIKCTSYNFRQESLIF